MIPIKEMKKFIVLSKEELELLKGGQKNYSNGFRKGDWGLKDTSNPPHD